MQNQARLPIYIQLSELLTREIASGRLLNGEKLPPERVMAAELNTTVRTLRKALDELTKKGLLERRQGSGNYVTSKADDVESVYSFFRIELLDGGGLPTAKVLSVDTMQKPDDIPKFGTSEIGHRIRRMRFLNDVPSLVEEIWLDGSCTPELKAEDLNDSLYYFYKNSLKLWITRAEDKVGVRKLPDWTPDDFGMKAGEASGVVERLSWAQENQTIEFSRNWFDYNKVRYVARIK